METFQLYKDMKARTNGELYLGIVGPVRTGKSTFIKRFMELLVLPRMKEESERVRTKDELPQSASGTTVMTTEPKFVPKNAARLHLDKDLEVSVRLIDCVGFMIQGATGYLEGKKERQVKTPWFQHEIPFTKAATIGTQKVIREHSTVGIVVTTDGSIGTIPRQHYVAAEERTVQELKAIGKPFVIILNSKNPGTKETENLRRALEKKYQIAVMSLNCEKMKVDEIHQLMKTILYEFPISEIGFYLPKWVEMLSQEHPIRQEVLETVKFIMGKMTDMRSAMKANLELNGTYIEKNQIEMVEMDSGKVSIRMHFHEHYYYEALSEWGKTAIKGERDLILLLQEFSTIKEKYERVKDAFGDVKRKGYGVVCPEKEEIQVDEPEIIKQGNQYGVKIHSEAPSIHMIRAKIVTEIAPIVGNEQQAKDLIAYIKSETDENGTFWKANIFGKSIEELVLEGVKGKLSVINEESQMKLQDTMQKIVNESTGGIVCIII